MKVLRIYDHLGELKKEFPIYVEGQDFKWQASVPEVIWLGTIVLEEAGKEPEAEPTPSPVSRIEDLPEEEQRILAEEAEAESRPQPEPELSPGEVVEEPTHKVVNVITKDEVIPKEVKHEPKKVHGKRGRVKRTPSPSDSKGTEVLHQDDPGGDTSKGD